MPANEPKPELGAPECPPHLHGEARAKWQELAPRLEAAGILTKIDGEALAITCAAWGRWVKAELILEEKGEVILSCKGLEIKSHWLNVSAKAVEQMKAFFTEFGLTPSSRSRINVAVANGSKDEKDPAEKYFSGPRLVK